ncbi:Acyl CoA:acetate/3-ketoacid CoA transferase [Serratia fonticola]|uniref:Acyl CoA:acetate/3-ketoacid CoA transferase n=1 Tax=Serratia fonticola TaxID=47917 RepID=A0A4U9TS13_SERFO|nr:Acyl CoA:acetate/3-ketoacid CoA transferase [Serratia fonticola]
MYLDALVIAQAVHNNGGIVMMQVQKMVKKATLHPKSVRIPGYLVDIVVSIHSRRSCMAAPGEPLYFRRFRA